MENLNIGAILVSTFLAFAVGGLWYSPKMFLNVWLKESNMKQQMGHGPQTYIAAFVFYLVASVTFNRFIADQQSPLEIVKLSAVIGICWVGTSFGINYKFAGKSRTLLLIDAGYHIVQFLIYGVTFGYWPR